MKKTVIYTSLFAALFLAACQIKHQSRNIWEYIFK